jgi:hypothetical protein
LALSAQGVAWKEELVIDEGRMEFGLDLSRAYQNHAEILASAGRQDESRAVFEKSETMLRHLYVHHPSRVAEELALLYRKRALRLGREAGVEGAPDLERAIGLYEVQLKEGGVWRTIPFKVTEQDRQTSLRTPWKASSQALIGLKIRK